MMIMILLLLLLLLGGPGLQDVARGRAQQGETEPSPYYGQFS